jgi:DNA adenine methylase
VTRPLIKWAGGKRQLLPHLLARVPDRYGTYFEPFIGGGALFVELAHRGRHNGAVISDLNPELVNLYSVVQSRPDDLIRELADPAFENTEEAFFRFRDEFNALINTPKCPVRRAALFIYLNKHSYNGLWRVNRSGKYNVPFGRHARLALPTPEDVHRFCRILQGVAVRGGDFAKVTSRARQGDLVYFDPPYQPVSKTANFTDYTKAGFDFSAQERLARTFSRLADRGVHVMLSNSDVPEIEALYEGFAIQAVPAKRFINCNGERRNGAMELIVTNY